jgi:hypothetical protein
MSLRRYSSGGDRGRDGRREQHRHSFCRPLIPGGNEPFGILKNLGISRAPVCRFLLRGFAALIFHLAAIEAHSRCSIATAFCQVERCKSRPVFSNRRAANSIPKPRTIRSTPQPRRWPGPRRGDARNNQLQHARNISMHPDYKYGFSRSPIVGKDS